MRPLLMGFLLLCMTLKAQQHPITKESFNVVNLNFPGLEKVNKQYKSGHYNAAAKALLTYYRTRPLARNTVGNKSNPIVKLSRSVQQTADNAMQHKFMPHKGYGFFDYGKDIDWQIWPVKDNEVRWQLHRLNWFSAMANAYLVSGNEGYAREWIVQFRDWVKKNRRGLSADNDRYAWRALETSERMNSLPEVFNTFVHTEEFTPSFLLEFLQSYADHADYLIKNYAEKGNHRLFEAQRALKGGCFFPEIGTAANWRKSGFTILTDEIKKQVYPDGMQWELAPGYHNAMISTFINGIKYAKEAGMDSQIPESYRSTVQKMILATINFSFPDYTFPMFGDAWLTAKEVMLQRYDDWLSTYPDIKVIQYFATEGKSGKLPAYLSRALPDAGFYTFRNGWDAKSTVMVLKASPPGEFHAQPDNGTFELWIRGRNFTPDAGAFVYSGDSEITRQRDWYRQTRVHSTVTLDNQNMVITQAHRQKWITSNNLDLLTYTNPSYKALDHRRSVLFVDQEYFIIIDALTGDAKGQLGAHFQLKEDSKPTFNQEKKLVYTGYDDNNNLLIQNLNSDTITLQQEDGKVSYEYKKETARPAFVFGKQKSTANAKYFITVLYPYTTKTPPVISLTENMANNYAQGMLDINLTIEGSVKHIKTNIVQ